MTFISYYHTFGYKLRNKSQQRVKSITVPVAHMSSTGSAPTKLQALSSLADFEREEDNMLKDRVKGLREMSVCLHALCKQTVDEGKVAVLLAFLALCLQ